MILSWTEFLDATELAKLLVFEGRSQNLCKLEYMDLSYCIEDMNSTALFQFISTIKPNNLLHLNLAWLDKTVNDDIAILIAICCTRLQILNLEAAMDETEYGVGLIAYACRDTLKCLALNDCEDVQLYLLLLPTCHGIIRQRASASLVPSNFVGNSDTLLRSVYPAAIRESLNEMMVESTGDSIKYSLQLFSRIKQVVNRQGTTGWNKPVKYFKHGNSWQQRRMSCRNCVAQRRSP